VQLIGVLWILLGLSAVVAVLFWSTQEWSTKLGPICLAASVIANAAGLFRRRPNAWHFMFLFSLGPLLVALPLLVLAVIDSSWPSFFPGISRWSVVFIGASVIAATFLVWQVWVLTRPHVAELYRIEIKAFWGRPTQWGVGLAIYLAVVVVVVALAWSARHG
jgi:hypothetical protein